MLWWPPGLSKLTEMNLLAEGRACSAVVPWGRHSPGPHLLKRKQKEQLFSLSKRVKLPPSKKWRECLRFWKCSAMEHRVHWEWTRHTQVLAALSTQCPGGRRGRLKSARVNFSINKVLEQRTRQGEYGSASITQSYMSVMTEFIPWTLANYHSGLRLERHNGQKLWVRIEALRGPMLCKTRCVVFCVISIENTHLKATFFQTGWWWWVFCLCTAGEHHRNNN